MRFCPGNRYHALRHTRRKTQAVVQKIVAGARATAASLKDGDQLILGIFAELGKTGSHDAIIRVYLADPEIREKIISTEQFSQRCVRRAAILSA